jgi:hypothetical protein
MGWLLEDRSSCKTGQGVRGFVKLLVQGSYSRQSNRANIAFDDPQDVLDMQL